MSLNEIEFFNFDAGSKTTLDDTTLKHHFNFGTYYQPTKFGRSTLRRADYIVMHQQYHYVAKRHFTLSIYSKSVLTLSINAEIYTINPCEYYAFAITEETEIIFQTDHPNAEFLLFEYDDTLEASTQTQGEIIHIDKEYLYAPLKKPHFAIIVSGIIEVSDRKLCLHDAFYTQDSNTLYGNGSLISFSMPIPI